MGFRRPPAEPDDEVDLEAVPPSWAARWLFVLRWGDELMGGSPSYAHNHRTIYNAGPVDPCLERVRRWWVEKDPEQRRSVWADDAGWIGFDGTQHCSRHEQSIAFCDPDCPAVARIQRQHDESHAHAWKNPTPQHPMKETP